MEKRERLAEFILRMKAAPAVATMESAMSLLAETMKAVEDEFSGVTDDPNGPDADRRLFPPLDDKYHFSVDGRADLNGYLHVGHETIFGANGAILIRTRRTRRNLEAEIVVLLNKAGIDGRTVGL
jgi:hypothetical protein